MNREGGGGGERKGNEKRKRGGEVQWQENEDSTKVLRDTKNKTESWNFLRGKRREFTEDGNIIIGQWNNRNVITKKSRKNSARIIEQIMVGAVSWEYYGQKSTCRRIEIRKWRQGDWAKTLSWSWSHEQILTLPESLWSLRLIFSGSLQLWHSVIVWNWPWRSPRAHFGLW